MLVPVRTLRALGAETLLVFTNAAGSLRQEVGPGRLMAIADHINLHGRQPAGRSQRRRVGPRFPSLATPTTPSCSRRWTPRPARSASTSPRASTSRSRGPSFETPAEIRAFRALGADAVGMSTVPEAIAARHCGLRVAAVTAITNLAEGMGDEALSHEQTLARRRGRRRATCSAC